jgi:hypothetical protein
MYKTDKNRINRWEKIEKQYKTAFNRIETLNGFAFDQNSSTKPMDFQNSNFYTVNEKFKTNVEPTNIHFNTKNKEKYFYSQAPEIIHPIKKSLLYTTSNKNIFN